MDSALREALTDWGQEHVLQAYDALLEGDAKVSFLADLKSVDVTLMRDLWRKHCGDQAGSEGASKVEPWPTTTAPTPEQRTRYWEQGLDMIKQGQVAAVLLAGGQGTRLGSSDPKGMYNIGLPSGKSLYQLQAERLLRLKQLSGAANAPVWYIMTSEATRASTVSFLESHQWFGLRAEDVIVFEQHTLPCLDSQGKLLMASPHSLATAPNGNGGVYSALVSEGITGDMRRRGVSHVFVYGVDNCVVRICDPTFMGAMKAQGADAGSKVVPKKSPTEAVGVLARKDGRPAVVEYSEISHEMAHARLAPTEGQEVGTLVYNAANICMHAFTVELLEKVGREAQLPFHKASKSIPYWDSTASKVVKPAAPNGVKFEMFVFDSFAYCQQLMALQVERNDEFLPLKNAPGAASATPEACRQGMYALHTRWITAAGGSVEEDACACEVSPLVSYQGEQLEAHVDGKSFTPPVHLQALSETTKA